MKKIKAFLIELSKKNAHIRRILRKIKYILERIKYIPFYLFNRVDNNLILFESFGGSSCSCSPKAIYKYMRSDKKYKNYKYAWVFKDVDKEKKSFDDDVILIKKNSIKYYKYLAKSKYWIVNSLINTGIIKKKNQVYVQCWHGTPLKKIRCDVVLKGNALNDQEDIKMRNDLDVKKIDYFISPSEYATEKFISAFNLKGLNKENVIIEKGYPRNDFLTNYKESDIDVIKKKLNISNDKKIILYAPTFRDDEHKSGIGYTYSLNIDFDLLKKELKGNYIILFRAHYFIANSFNFDKYKGFVYDVSSYDDINELYVISDLLVTDYSSVFFDYAILNRPIIYYMYDYDNYKKKLRDFYIDISELPGPIVKNEDDLIKNIINIEDEFKIYSKKYLNFNKKFNPYEDGNSTKRVVKEIFK